jgi:Papain family cysteine protease
MFFIATISFAQIGQVPIVFSNYFLKTPTKTGVVTSDANKKSINLPDVVSLRPYCPKPQNQGETNACTAWATTYGALTISRAVQLNVTDTAALQRMSYSASFVFNALTDSLSKSRCKESVNLLDCLLFLQENGTCLASTFPNTSDCNMKAGSSTLLEASKNTILDFEAAFRSKGDSISKIREMRQLLAAKKPVVITLPIRPSLKKMTKKTPFWYIQADETNDSEAHAVVIIGYNHPEQYFELMNSWGSDWGDGGFAKISYSDFIQRTIQAYYLDL